MEGQKRVGAHLIPLGRTLAAGSKVLPSEALSQLAKESDPTSRLPGRVLEAARAAAAELLPLTETQATTLYEEDDIGYDLPAAEMPSIGIYIVTSRRVALGNISNFFQRFDSAVRAQISGGSRFAVRVEIEYLGQGSLFAQFAVLRKSKSPNARKRTNPWKRADALSLASVLLASAALANDVTPFRSALDSLFAEDRVNSVVVTDGRHTVAITGDEIFLSEALDALTHDQKRYLDRRNELTCDTYASFYSKIGLDKRRVIATYNGKPITIVDMRKSLEFPLKEGVSYRLSGRIMLKNDEPRYIELSSAELGGASSLGG